MAKNNSSNWVKYIDQAKTIYLNRKQRRIGMSPLNGNKKTNEKDIQQIYFEKHVKLDNAKKTFSIGDTVKI